MSQLELHSRYSPGEAVAAFAPRVRPEWFCEQQFAVLLHEVLLFTTLGTAETETRFPTTA